MTSHDDTARDDRARRRQIWTNRLIVLVFLAVAAAYVVTALTTSHR